MRQGNRASGYECSTSSSWTSTLMSLAGGIGLGAGLLYLLDPDEGERRRQRIMSGARQFGSNIAESASDMLTSAGDYAGDTASGMSKSTRKFASRRADEASGMVGGALTTIRDFVNDKLSGASDYASEKYEGTKGYFQDRLGRETRAQHRVSMGLCALSSMAVGAALMYVFDPTMGRGRRQYAANRASDLASQAGDYASQAGGYVREQASSIASKAGDAVNQAKDKVSGMASNLRSSDSGPSCPPGMIPESQLNAGRTGNVSGSSSF